MTSLVPIIVGVGDIVNRSLKLEDAVEPADLILRAIQQALSDTGLDIDARLLALQDGIDSITIVRTWTWPYTDLPGLLSARLGLSPKHKEYTDNGGDKPVKLVDEAARRIVKGECRVAIIAGGEALASLNEFAKVGKLPPPKWTAVDKTVDSVFSPTTAETALHKGIGKPHGIGTPVQIYPLFENGFRAHTGQSLRENHEESVKLYADFAGIAQRNEFAWNSGSALDKDTIGIVKGRNRMIDFPYPLLMNAFNTVNLAAACILTSTEFAAQLGIPEHKWIYPLGGAGTQDRHNFWERPNYHSSPSIERTIDATLQVSNLTKDNIDCYDIYSCFPIVPKLAARHLGLSPTHPEKPLTLLGGLTSFGGAGNNYSLHAVNAAVRAFRKHMYRTGLILANGGVLTYQYAICLSTTPRPHDSPYPTESILPTTIVDVPIPPVIERAEGEAVVETYTVDFDRKNNPVRGHIVGRLKSTGHRFLANHGDEDTLRELASWTREPIGQEGVVWPDPACEGRNLFTFVNGSKL